MFCIGIYVRLMQTHGLNSQVSSALLDKFFTLCGAWALFFPPFAAAASCRRFSCPCLAVAGFRSRFAYSHVRPAQGDLVPASTPTKTFLRRLGGPGISPSPSKRSSAQVRQCGEARLRATQGSPLACCSARILTKSPSPHQDHSKHFFMLSHSDVLLVSKLAYFCHPEFSTRLLFIYLFMCFCVCLFFLVPNILIWCCPAQEFLSLALLELDAYLGDLRPLVGSNGLQQV